MIPRRAQASGLRPTSLRGRAAHAALWVLVVLLFGSTAPSAALADSGQTYRWARENRVIAHAMGGIEGRIYTNSREAWKNSYDRGYRIMEVDFRFLGDGTLVCTHDAPRDSKVADFRSSLVMGSFASVTATDLAALMVDYPDVWVMADFKLGPGLQKQALSELRSILGGDTSRIIVQIYDDSGYWVARRLGYREIVYTLFRQPKSRWAHSIDFAAKHRIMFVSMSADRMTPGMVRRARKKGLWVGIHPVNRTYQRSQLRRTGATHIYSSFLAP